MNPLKRLTAKIRLRRRRRYRGDFVRRPRYSLQVVNQSKLSTMFSYTARRWQFVAAGVMLFLVVGLLWLLAFVYTPLSALLPTRLASSMRDEYTQLAVRIDSISALARVNQRYYDNIRAVLTDSLAPAPEPAGASALDEIPLDSLMTQSEQERRFVDRFESEERYNLSVLSPIAADGMNFFPPVGGAGLEVRRGEGPIPSVSVTPAQDTPVSAVYRGTVISTFYSAGRGVTVVIQHPNEFITEYSGLADLLVARGDKVSAGERIGLARPGRYPLTFELWHKGSALDPAEYISFGLPTSP